MASGRRHDHTTQGRKMRYLLLLTLAALTTADLFRYDGYKTYSVFTHTVEDVKALHQLMLTDDQLDFWEVPNKEMEPVVVMVPPHYQDDFRTIMADLSLAYTVHDVNVQDQIDVQLKEMAAKTSVNTDTWMTYSEINDFMAASAAGCPASLLCEITSIGNSVQGRATNMISIKSAGADANTPIYWVDSTVHAREWLATMTAVKIIEHLTSGNADSDLYGYEWLIVPVANPDGYTFTHTNQRLWRKNRNPVGSGCIGVDLNRNFAWRWGAEGVSHSPCSDLYCGPSAASEVETVNMQNAILAVASKVKALVTIHSYGRMWMHPWGNTVNHNGFVCERASDHDEMYAAAVVTANAVQSTYNQGNWARGTSCEVIYETTGATDDWAKGGAGIQFTFNPELRGNSFIVGTDQIDLSFNEVWNGMKALVNHLA